MAVKLFIYLFFASVRATRQLTPENDCDSMLERLINEISLITDEKTLLQQESLLRPRYRSTRCPRRTTMMEGEGSVAGTPAGIGTTTTSGSVVDERGSDGKEQGGEGAAAPSEARLQEPDRPWFATNIVDHRCAQTVRTRRCFWGDHQHGKGRL